MTFSIAFGVDSVLFTPGVVSGKESLGGSESAMVGLARALAARGHAVHIFATKLSPECEGVDHAGVTWHHASDQGAINTFTEWDVFVALRMVHWFDHGKVRARLRILWNQDLLIDGPMKFGIMGRAWALDKVVYVSEFARRQWEEIMPEVKALGYVTRNGFDPALVATGVTKDPNRVIHISRPERGLRPLLNMWGRVREKNPDATLYLCRYSSMYDAHGWGETCKKFDQAVAEVHKAVGGIVHMGELGKPALYHAIAASAVMWYPGVVDFAETSCIAGIEAQANGTPLVCSYKGALPETAPHATFIRGDADAPEYQEQAIDAVLHMLSECKRDSFAYRKLRQAGLEHAERYAYPVLAEEWERWIDATFRERYETHKIGVLRQLLHYDDHTAAKIVARDVIDSAIREGRFLEGGEWVTAPADVLEARDADILCDRVIAGKDQVAEDYAARASDPLLEAEHSSRMKGAAEVFDGCTHVLDIACGPGSFALALAKRYPAIRVTSVDYAQQNIERARAAAEQLGVADRCTFLQASAYDFDAGRPVDLTPIVGNGPFDGAFVGEFLEHCGDAPALIDAIEALLVLGAQVFYTVPYGPMGELIPRTIPHLRGHVHHFSERDLIGLFGAKEDVSVSFLHWGGLSPRGEPCGNWAIRYTTSGAPTGRRPYRQRIVTTRPYVRLSVGILATHAEFDLPRCLDSFWGIADQIVIGLCDADDETRRIAETFDAGHGHRRITVLDLPAIHDIPTGFAGARNAVLAAATGDFFLWIDTDETLMNAIELHKYLESGPFKGFALRQTHLMIDAAPNWDTPVRLFRRLPEIQFYGCVHEQPQWGGDCNADIYPSLELSDVLIPHLGYLTEDQRRKKMLWRNRALLVRDQELFEERLLGKVLWIREYVNMADLEREEHGGEFTAAAKGYFQQVVGLFEKFFPDPAHKYHKLARPFYERAVQMVNGALHGELALVIKPNGLGDVRAKPFRVWARNLDAIQQQIDYRMGEIRKQMNPPKLRVDPYDEDTPADAVQEAPASVA